MNILVSVRKEWSDKIFDGTKPFEYRSITPKDIKVGDEMYIYESKSGGGIGKVIGRCVVSNIFDTSTNKIKEFFDVIEKNNYYGYLNLLSFLKDTGYYTDDSKELKRNVR